MASLGSGRSPKPALLATERWLRDPSLLHHRDRVIAVARKQSSGPCPVLLCMFARGGLTDGSDPPARGPLQVTLLATIGTWSQRGALQRTARGVAGPSHQRSWMLNANAQVLFRTREAAARSRPEVATAGAIANSRSTSVLRSFADHADRPCHVLWLWLFGKSCKRPEARER